MKKDELDQTTGRTRDQARSSECAEPVAVWACPLRSDRHYSTLYRWLGDNA